MFFNAYLLEENVQNKTISKYYFLFEKRNIYPDL